MEVAQKHPLTKEEIEKWIYRCAIDEDASPNMEFETSFFEMCLITASLQSRLRESEFSTFMGLAYKKCKHLHVSSEPWSSEEQEQLEGLQDKAINRSQEKLEKLSHKAEKRRENNEVRGQPVRIKRTGRIGVGVGSLDSTASKGILVRFDEGDSEFINDREDLEIICPVCNKGAERRCSKCKQRWYCGRECQIANWQEHKKSCKEMAAAAAAAPPNKEEELKQKLEIGRAYAAKEAAKYK